MKHSIASRIISKHLLLTFRIPITRSTITFTGDKSELKFLSCADKTAQKMKFSINDSYLLKKSLMENFVLCAEKLGLNMYAFRSHLTVDIPHLQVTLDLFDAHFHIYFWLHQYFIAIWYVAVFLCTFECSKGNLSDINEL